MRKDIRKGRKRVKIKIFVTGISLPICNRELKKNSKKLKKLTNTIMAYCPANPGWERQRERVKKKKIIVPIVSYPNPNSELKKK